MPEISNAFANPTDKTYRNYTYQENVTYGETVTSVSEYFLDIVFVYPILTGLDCSIYLKIEVETDADVVSSSVARENWQDIMGRQLSFPVYRPTDGNSTVSYNKNSIVSLVVKTPQNTYYISDFDGNNSYSFDSRFFLILRGILTGGTNSFNILYNDRLDFSGKEYEIGIRFAFPDFYYLNIKFGTYEDRILKKIDGENKTYYNTTPLNFDGVDVDIYTKENDGFVYQWSGTISSAEYDTVVSTEDRQDGSIQRRDKKFNINTTGEPTKTFFFWFNLNLNSDTVFVVPKDDYTVSLLRFFKNPNLYTSFVYDLSWSNLYAVTDENGGETVELAIAERPTDTAEKDEWRADIYRFNAATLKWERRPNAVSPLSQLTAPSDFISYHPTPSN